MAVVAPHQTVVAKKVVVVQTVGRVLQPTIQLRAHVMMVSMVLQSVINQKLNDMKKISFKNVKDVLNRDEMKEIMAGSGRGGSCNASASNCANVSCSCDGSGTCTSGTNSATCTCDGVVTTVNCPPA